MRLIDADSFMENVRKELDCDGICGSCENDNLCEIFSMVFYQPTAYDIDKVVKQLRERVENFKSFNSGDEIVDVAIKEIQRDGENTLRLISEVVRWKEL